MLKRILSIVLVVVVLAGCGTTPKEIIKTEDSETTVKPEESIMKTGEEPVVVTDLTLMFADGDAKAKEAIYAIVDGFNATQESYNISVEPGVGGAYDELLKTKESVGDFPDIVEMRDTAIYVRAGLLAPISEEIQALFVTTTDFYGDVYTAPMAAEGTQGIMYNKAYFEEHGLNEAPSTWDEFMALCQDIQDLGDMSPIVVGGNDIWHMGFWFSKIYTDNIMMVNESFIENLYAGETSWQSEPAARATFEQIQELFMYVDEGWGSTPDAMITTFIVGDMAAMMYSGTWMLTQVEDADPDFELGWFPVPDKNGHTNLVGGAGKGGWSISAKAAEDPNKVAAYEAFVRYFFDKDVYGAFTKALSFFPTTVESPSMEVTPLLQKVMDAAEEADYLSQMWNGKVGFNELPPDYRNYTYKIVVEVLVGVKTIDEALDSLDATWKTTIEYFNPVTGVGLE